MVILVCGLDIDVKLTSILLYCSSNLSNHWLCFCLLCVLSRKNRNLDIIIPVIIELRISICKNLLMQLIWWSNVKSWISTWIMPFLSQVSSICLAFSTSSLWIFYNDKSFTSLLLEYQYVLYKDMNRSLIFNYMEIRAVYEDMNGALFLINGRIHDMPVSV